MNFAVTGTLLFVFVRELRHQFKRTTSGRIAGALLTLLALALGLSAFNTDRGTFGGTPDNVARLGARDLLHHRHAQRAHRLPAAALALRRNEHWRGFSLAAVLVALSIPLGLAIPGGAGFYAVLLLLFGWFGLAARRLSKLTRPNIA